MNPLTIPGCVFIGYVSDDNVNNGSPVPLFEPIPSPDKQDINTMDGWNTIADQGNRRSFRLANGRDPVNDAELDSWVYANI